MSEKKPETDEARLARHNDEVAALTNEHLAAILELRRQFPDQTVHGSVPSPLDALIAGAHAKFATAAQALTAKHRAETVVKPEPIKAAGADKEA